MTLPSGISGLAGWWAADAIVGLTDGQAVSSWADASSANIPLVQATGGAQPTYRATGLNGLPIVQFAAGQSLAAGTQQAASCPDWFIVASLNAATLPGHLALIEGNGTEGGTASVLTGSGAAGTKVWLSLGGGMVYNYNGNLATAALNPPLNGLWAFMEVQFPGLTRLFTVMGKDLTNAAVLAGFVAEVFCFTSVLSSTDRQAMNLYLSQKWGIASPSTFTPLRMPLGA